MSHKRYFSDFSLLDIPNDELVLKKLLIEDFETITLNDSNPLN